MSSILRNWRRRRALSRIRFSETLWREVLALPLLAQLDDSERHRLRELVAGFLDEKSFEAGGGLELDERMRLRISAEACLLILNLGLDYYRGWRSVIVYPHTFVAHHRYTDIDGVEHDDLSALAGESWDLGPVIISWGDVINSNLEPGFNVVIHEFAHKLDTLNGVANGFPPLHRDMQATQWSRVFTTAYDKLGQRLDGGLETVINPYARESPAEFFAVMSEAFFEIPDALCAHYPDVFEQLCAFYRYNPAR